jgi:FixJ family two-component response regulator
LLDVNLPDRSGLEMLRELDAPRYPAPILIVSGQRDVPTAVNAIRGGALDFIEKPFEAAAVVARVRDAIRAWTRRARLSAVAGAEHLTPRERQVLLLVTSGASSKEAGRALGISPRTVEVHRASIMHKLGAKNATDLVRLVLQPEQWH